MSRLKALWDDHGQAVWLDFIQRSLVSDGGLARLVAEDGVRGVTSNPSIFQQAIGGSAEYDGAIDAILAADRDATTEQVYEGLAIGDIRLAADALREVYDNSGGGDGFVSLEVNPHLARDSTGTVAEARRLWRAVDRPNLMIKVPATDEGIPAIEELIADGINVNATLIFSMRHYEGVAGAHLRGLERCAAPQQVASVASFFISRVDTVVDRELEALGSERALALRGRAAVANARRAYRRFRELYSEQSFAALAARGARVQRPLWASTSTKNPAYSDVLYVEELIAPDTVNTIPTVTLDAFRDHGQPRPSLEPGLADADEVVAELAALGVDLDAATEQLQVDGVAAFATSFDALMADLEAERAARARAS